jgi:hypothetical protein
LTIGRYAGIVTCNIPDRVVCGRLFVIDADVTERQAMTKIYRFDRKPALAAGVAGSNSEHRDRTKKKPAQALRPAQHHPSSRAQTESPRGSTIPAYPKERIDD